MALVSQEYQSFYNHNYMVELRQKKVDVIANDLPAIETFGEESGEVLVLGWGGTYGAIRSAVQRMIVEGKSVSHIHLRNLNPFPKDLGEKLIKFDKVVIPELNLGQLNSLIRSKFLIDTKNINKVEGKPFTPSEIYEEVDKIL